MTRPTTRCKLLSGGSSGGNGGGNGGGGSGGGVGNNDGGSDGGCECDGGSDGGGYGDVPEQAEAEPDNFSGTPWTLLLCLGVAPLLAFGYVLMRRFKR